jgi:hypothetical protein
MPLTKLQFRPGINRETTSYSNEGGWFDMDKVRFRFGFPEKIGGWEKTSSTYFLGTCRALHPWVALNGERYLGVGTHLKYYINEGGGYNDITPIRATTAAGDVTFQTYKALMLNLSGSLDISIDQTEIGPLLYFGGGSLPETGFVKIDDEIISYAAISGTTLQGCLRGQKGTDAATHTGLVIEVSFSTIVVTDTNHGALANDFVTFSGAASINASGNVGSVAVTSGLSTGSSTFNDVGQTSTSGSGTGAKFNITANSSNNTYTVNYVEKGGSGYADNDTITIAGTSLGGATPTNDLVLTVTTLAGTITSTILNQEYEISYVPNDNSYYINARTEEALASITTTDGINDTLVFANISSGSGAGGASTVGTYQINTGLDTTITGTGWGAGTWSRGTWGSAASLIASGQTLRIWSHDNFGEDLLINVRDAGIYYWDKTNGTSTRAVAISDLAGANTAPTIAKKVLVSDRDRHVIAFGCDSQLDIGTQDPLLIRFSDQGSITDWAATATNTAGDLRLGSGSEIVTAIETRQQVLVFTDVSLHAMQFLGPPFTFGINTVSENITIAGPLAAIAIEDQVYWMGAEEFYVYGGAVQRLPCTVRDFVFSDINTDQLEKVTASTNTAFSEIWWFYPSASSTECNKYVVYNYQQQIWYYGSLNRTVWLDRGVESFPIAASTDHALYYHERGFDDGSTAPATAITSFIESSQMSLGEGDNFVFLRRLIPDLTFRDSTAVTPSATMTLEARNYPGGAYLQTNSKTVTKTASVPVEQWTNQVNVRLRGRSFAFKIETTETGVGWRLGSPRVDVQPDGMR